MAGPAPPPVPFEYVRIYDLPAASTLPDVLRGRALYSRVNFIRAQSNNDDGADSGSNRTPSGVQQASRRPAQPVAPIDKGSGKDGGTGFNYSKALKAALDGAGSSVSSRGDGKFEGGRDFAISDAPGGRAKFVHLTPEALAGENAERTLADLDRLQQQAAAAGGGRPAAAAAAGGVGLMGRPGSTSTAAAASSSYQSRSGQQQHAAALAAVANILYDISDEDGGGSRARVGAAAAAPPRPAEGSAGWRVPEHIVRELPDGPTGQGQLEVSVLLPDVASPGEVEVWLGAGGELQVAVPGKYQLKLDLPCPVVDDTSHAKWSKAKRRLTLTLTKQRSR